MNLQHRNNLSAGDQIGMVQQREYQKKQREIFANYCFLKVIEI